jgi:fused signal recognition particle receptor
MGLISFLKEKFGRKKDQETKKYSDGMSKSRKNFSSKLKTLSARYKAVNQEYFEELEQILIESDVGINLTLNIIDEVLLRSKNEKITEPEKINEILVDRMFIGYASKGDIENEIRFKEEGPTVLLVVGVNGVGKTTTIAKLANRYINKGKKVLLVAADTFRAGATEQLTIWANRLGIEIVTGKQDADPASVAYDGVRKANQIGADLVIVDTAGRLQTKVNLMAELSKIKRVMSKEIPDAPHETFLIIDATTGQNGVIQAKAFAEVAELTGVVITKMDGTSKGGIILAIRDELGVPVRFIGLGEKMEDLTEFDLDKYLYGLCVED